MSTLNSPEPTADTFIETILKNGTGDVSTLCRKGEILSGIKRALLRAGIKHLDFFLYTPLKSAQPFIHGLGDAWTGDVAKVLDELGFSQSLTSGTNPQSESLFLILNTSVSMLKYKGYLKALTESGIYTVSHLSQRTIEEVRIICNGSANWQDFEALLTQKLAEEGLSFRAEQQEA
ncbi:MAG: hypothetical protein JNK26_00785 [Candidatus Doudnabacteria bacterium]|nr:hypothetical protein [Candidatus Doudnabacteria bacterium]